MSTPILRTAARILVGIMLVFSLFMLVRGHNAPGGGFIGGLAAAAAIALLAMSHGVATARRALKLPPDRVAALGIGAALLSGLISGLFGREPFSGLWLLLGADAGGKGLPLSTVLLFDLGVWLTVLGAASALVLGLEADDDTPPGGGDTP